MGHWLGGMLEKHFDKIMLFFGYISTMAAVVYFFVKGADDKILFFSFGAASSFQGGILILCNVRRPDAAATPITSGTETTSRTVTDVTQTTPPADVPSKEKPI